MKKRKKPESQTESNNKSASTSTEILKEFMIRTAKNKKEKDK